MFLIIMSYIYSKRNALKWCVFATLTTLMMMMVMLMNDGDGEFRKMQCKCVRLVSGLDTLTTCADTNLFNTNTPLVRTKGMQIQGVFLHWASPKKLKYGKPRLGESTLT